MFVDRQDHDQRDGHELLGREAHGVAAERASARSGIVIRPTTAERARPRNRAKATDDRRDRAGLHDEEHRPAEQEADERTVGLAEEDVLAARAGHHRGELGAAERAGDRHQARRAARRRAASRASRPAGPTRPT